MEVGLILGIAQTVLAAIQTLYILKNTLSSDGKDGLEQLQKNVNFVISLLEQADAYQDTLSSLDIRLLEELKDALYDAEDVLDECVSVGRQQHSHKVTTSIHRSFSYLMHNLSKQVKEVSDTLDTIMLKRAEFLCHMGNKRTRVRNNETCSFVSPSDIIIGRGKDVEKIVGMLLADDHQSNVSSLAIVGMGGLGKTALAQHVFNDPRITSAFQLKSWTCIADQDKNELDLKDILRKVLIDLLGGNERDLTSLEQMQHKVANYLTGKKYLLVLDDVWTEINHKWKDLIKYLTVGVKGSRIVVTTRSKKTAQVVGGVRVHELQGLSEKESWHLFKRMTNLPQRENPLDDFVKLGKKIVKMCKHVPLAIRVVGSLLRDQSKITWESFESEELASISKKDDTMDQILKLSYHQLDPPLKRCFAYCAIFPKDFEINKQMLISLWMSQGYISVDNVGDEYCCILYQRCFFQDVIMDKSGEIESFKIHDLLHDIAEKVSGYEIYKLTSNNLDEGSKVRHLSIINGSFTDKVFSKTYIRTCLQVKQPWTKGGTDSILFNESIWNWTCLRSLDLRRLKAKSLPKKIGKLIHLRYLDLSGSEALEELPKSIKKLVHLQTLDLSRCTSLQELPDGVSKLVDLTTLNLNSCNKLRCMPSDFDKLTSLRTLSLFVAGDRCLDRLESLRPLDNLKGDLVIKIGVRENAIFEKEYHGRRDYLSSKKRLVMVAIEFKTEEGYGNVDYEQALLEVMQPHYDLKELKLEGYHGKTMPKWLKREDSSLLFHLPNLVTLNLSRCQELMWLPSQIGELPCLKKLRLHALKNMEYVLSINSRPSKVEGSLFFPCLEEIYISKLPKLTGWWWRSGSGEQNQEHRTWEMIPCFAKLKKLEINHCPSLTYIPVPSCLESLRVIGNDMLLNCKNIGHIPGKYQSLRLDPEPKILTIHHLELLKLIPIGYIQGVFQKVAAIEIKDDKVVSLEEVKELLQPRNLSSLRFVKFERCIKLRNVGEWLTQLSNLHSLTIDGCSNLLNDMPWKDLKRSLRCLRLEKCTELDELPEGMQYCTSLSSLIICQSTNLRFLPKWMTKFTSLEKLKLCCCSRTLKERCKNPNGKDRHLVGHIPVVSVSEVQGRCETWVKEVWWH